MTRPFKIALLVLSRLSEYWADRWDLCGDRHGRQTWREQSETYQEELVAAGGWPMLAWYSPHVEWLWDHDASQHRRIGKDCRRSTRS